MIFIDSNVFVIDLRYERDPNYEVNAEFLHQVKDRADGATTMVNLLEVAGILSYNLNPKQLKSLVAHFPTHYGIRVYPPMEVGVDLPAVPVSRLLQIIQRRTSLGDALVLHQVEQYATAHSTLVTWDARHFKKKTALKVQTPEQFV